MFFAWAASIIYGFSSVVGKLSLKHSVNNAWFLNFIWQLFILLGILPVALIYGVQIPTEWNSILIAGVFTFLVSALYILSLKQLDVSVLSPLYNFRAVFTALIGAAFLNEILTGNQYILIGIIFIGGIFLNVNEHLKLTAFFRKEVLLGMLTILVSAVLGFTIKNAIAENGFWTASLWMQIVSQILLFATIPLFYKEVAVTPLKKYAGPILMGLLNAVGDLAANKAFASNVTISSAIISIPFSMLIAFFFSIFAPKLLEKHTVSIYMIRFAAATVMILAAIRLSD